LFETETEGTEEAEQGEEEVATQTQKTEKGLTLW